MNSPTLLMAGPLIAFAVSLFGAQAAEAEPLTPLMPAELEYLEQIRHVFAASQDNAAFHSDGELLDAGRFVCFKRDRGFLGNEATLTSPIITQVAFVYLCPK